MAATLKKKSFLFEGDVDRLYQLDVNRHKIKYWVIDWHRQVHISRGVFSTKFCHSDCITTSWLLPPFTDCSLPTELLALCRWHTPPAMPATHSTTNTRALLATTCILRQNFTQHAFAVTLAGCWHLRDHREPIKMLCCDPGKHSPRRFCKGRHWIFLIFLKIVWKQLYQKI